MGSKFMQGAGQVASLLALVAFILQFVSLMNNKWYTIRSITTEVNSSAVELQSLDFGLWKADNGSNTVEVGYYVQLGQNGIGQPWLDTVRTFAILGLFGQFLCVLASLRILFTSIIGIDCAIPEDTGNLSICTSGFRMCSSIFSAICFTAELGVFAHYFDKDTISQPHTVFEYAYCYYCGIASAVMMGTCGFFFVVETCRGCRDGSD